MATQEIKVVASFVDGISGPLKTAETNVKASATKISGDVAAIGKTASVGVAKDLGEMGMKTRETFSNMQQLSRGIIGGSIPDMFQGLVGVASGAMKSISIATALATGGITLAVSAITYLIMKTKEENAELVKANEEAAAAQMKIEKKMSDFIINESERAQEKRLEQYEDDLAVIAETTAKKIKKIELAEERIGDISVFSTQDTIDKIYELQQQRNDVDADDKKAALAALASYNADIAKIEQDAADKAATKKKAADAIKKEKTDSDWFIREDQRKTEEAWAEKEMARKVKDNEKEWAMRAAMQQAQENQDAIDTQIAEEQNRQAVRRFNYQNETITGIGDIAGAMGQLNTALKGDAETSKSLAITQAIINTAVGVTKAYAQGGALGFVTGSAIAIAGAAQVATIEAQKFADGGIVSGPSTGDQVPIRANGGEAVFTINQQRQMFDMINGGSKSAGGTVVLQIPASSTIDYNAGRYMVKQIERLARDGAFDKAFAFKKSMRA